MARYRFMLDRFMADRMRSKMQNDQLWSCVSATLDGITVMNPLGPCSVTNIGPTVSQDFPPALHVEFEARSAAQSLVINYLLMNIGQPLNVGSMDIDDINALLTYIAYQLASTPSTAQPLLAYPLANVVPAPTGATIGSFVSSVEPNVVDAVNSALGGVLGFAASHAAQIALDAVSAAFGDCDGPVAVDQIVLSGDSLAELTAAGPHVEQRDYPGLPSKCQSSRYSIGWSLRAVPAEHLYGRVVSRRKGHFDLFWVSPVSAELNTNVWDQNRYYGVWNRPTQLPRMPAGPNPPSAPVSSAIASVSRYSDHLDLFWVARDGSIMTSWWDADNTPWTTPIRIAPPRSADVRSPVAAIARTANHLDVFWIAPDGSIYIAWWNASYDGGAWSAPSLIAESGSAVPGSTLCVVATSGASLALFWVAPVAGKPTFTRVVTLAWSFASDGVEWIGGRDNRPVPVDPLPASAGACDGTDIAVALVGGRALFVFWEDPFGRIMVGQSENGTAWTTQAWIGLAGEASIVPPLQAPPNPVPSKTTDPRQTTPLAAVVQRLDCVNTAGSAPSVTPVGVPMEKLYLFWIGGDGSVQSMVVDFSYVYSHTNVPDPYSLSMVDEAAAGTLSNNFPGGRAAHAQAVSAAGTASYKPRTFIQAVARPEDNAVSVFWCGPSGEVMVSRSKDENPWGPSVTAAPIGSIFTGRDD